MSDSDYVWLRLCLTQTMLDSDSVWLRLCLTQTMSDSDYVWLRLCLTQTMSDSDSVRLRLCLTLSLSDYVWPIDILSTVVREKNFRILKDMLAGKILGDVLTKRCWVPHVISSISIFQAFTESPILCLIFPSIYFQLSSSYQTFVPKPCYNVYTLQCSVYIVCTMSK